MTHHDDRSARRLLCAGATIAGLGVAAGAFGAHGLREQLSLASLETFRTGAGYQLLHGVAIVAIAGAMSHFNRRRMRIAGWLLVIGVVLFSGSLYLLSLSGIRAFGLVTPVGGGVLLLGWGVLILASLRAESPSGGSAGGRTSSAPGR